MVIVLGLTLDELTIACILLNIYRQSARARERGRVRVCRVLAVNMVKNNQSLKVFCFINLNILCVIRKIQVESYPTPSKNSVERGKTVEMFNVIINTVHHWL